jgi:DNA polymerase V
MCSILVLLKYERGVTQMIFLIDGNSFFAECERLKRPALRDSPIAVLSGSEGVVIALDTRCKELGFKRGDAYFQVKKEMLKKGVQVFSADHALYAQVSSKINDVYRTYTEELEPYSIDESFLYLPDWTNANYSEIGFEIREAVLKQVGVPVSVGIAKTKTLAKLCNKLAKKTGVCEWAMLDGDAVLAATDAGDIWGIGRNKKKFLFAHGVRSALDLKNYPLDKAKKYLTISGFNTVRELNGFPSIERSADADQKSVMVSRTVARPIYDMDALRACIIDYTAKAVQKLRADSLVARYVTVFIRTSYWNDDPKYSASETGELSPPSSVEAVILKTALSLLGEAYREGFKYKKIGVVLNGLSKHEKGQQSLFENDVINEKQERLQRSIDEIKRRFGAGAIHTGESLEPR